MIQILIIFCNLYNYRAPINDRIDPRCFEKAFIRAWVFFTDKGITVDNYNKVLLNTKKTLNHGSLLRRNLRKGIIDFSDIPVKEEYIEEIQNSGGILLHRSKWLNAASFLINRDNLVKIASYDFVHKIIPVAKYNKISDTEIVLQDTTGILTNRQIQMFKIDSLHKIGIFGSNVKVGFLDTGLRRTHIALESLKVIAEYDFLGGDQIYL
ncbi:MAG: hypothetical protein ABIL18_06395, partial [candidate division WOR-3 bacterium]